MYTEKYIRNETQWIKVTRDSIKKTFIFARGYKGNNAHDIQTYSFKWVPSWKEAMEKAEIRLSTFA